MKKYLIKIGLIWIGNNLVMNNIDHQKIKEIVDILNSISLKDQRSHNDLYRYSDRQVSLQYLQDLNNIYLNKFWEQLPLLEEITLHNCKEISIVYDNVVLFKDHSCLNFSTFKNKKVENESLNDLNNFLNEYFVLANSESFSFLEKLPEVTLYRNNCHSLM